MVAWRTNEYPSLQAPNSFPLLISHFSVVGRFSDCQIGVWSVVYKASPQDLDSGAFLRTLGFSMEGA